MRADAARGFQVDGHVALTVETAAVTQVAVIEQQRVDVGGLGPADALDGYRDVTARFHHLRRDQRDARRNDVLERLHDVAGHGLEGVAATEVVGGGNGKREGAFGVGADLVKRTLDLVPAGAADAVTGDAAPQEFNRRRRREAAAADGDRAADDAGAVVDL